MSEIIEGIKLIEHNMGGVNNPDDPSFGPFMLTMKCRIAGMFMEFAAIVIYGNYEVVRIRGKTKEALEQVIERNKFRTHPRLVSLEITEPELTTPTQPARDEKR